jgi:yecA family protein
MSTTEALISFEELNHLLVPLGALNSPSELHGMLCGKLSGGARLSSEEWAEEALTFLDVITNEEEGVVGDPEGLGQTAVARLYHVTLSQLEDSQYRFEVMLPADNAELERRTAALGEWCHGFLSGFGSAGLAADTTFSAEAAEALRDLAAIVSIGEGEEDDDEAEADFAEVVEYVRMAVLTLFTDFGQVADAKPVLH